MSTHLLLEQIYTTCVSLFTETVGNAVNRNCSNRGVMLLHSVSMVCDLSPCYKIFPKLQIQDQTLNSGFYCERHVLSRARASNKNTVTTFKKI